MLSFTSGQTISKQPSFAQHRNAGRTPTEHNHNEYPSPHHDIIAFADLEDFVDTPIKFYSSGMRSRLAFSVAVYAEADIFLMDEVFGGVGDVNFKEKSKKVFEDAFLDKRTILFVSHSLTNILQFSNKVLLIDRGEQLAFGDPKAVVDQYQELMKLG